MKTQILPKWGCCATGISGEEVKGFSGESGRESVAAKGVDIIRHTPGIDGLLAGIVEAVGCAHIAVSRMTDRAAIDQEPFPGFEEKILEIDAMWRSAGSEEKEPGCMTVADKEQRFGHRPPGCKGIGGVDYVIELIRPTEIAMRATKRVSCERERKIPQPANRGGREGGTGPFEAGLSHGIEMDRIEITTEGCLMVPEDHLVGGGMQGLENFGRVRAVPDHVAQTEDTVGLEAFEIEPDSVPCLKIGMDIGNDGNAHGPLLPDDPRCGGTAGL
jgi:hypothetical protein